MASTFDSGSGRGCGCSSAVGTSAADPTCALLRPRPSLESVRQTTTGESMPLTQTQLAAAVAERSGLSKTQAKEAIQALEDVVLDEIGNAEKVKIGNLVQLTVRVKPPTKAREGRNPATGEEITIGPKPASVDVRARVLAK